MNEVKVIEANTSDFALMTAAQRAELDVQITTAKTFPRSVKSSLQNAVEMATMTTEIAESCIYSLPRGGKNIEGPSIRLAEILVSSWGNVHAGQRVIGVVEKSIVAEAVVWDLEKNNKITVQQSRRATNKDGKLFNDDMIIVTGNAAASIAFRNAVFKIIPNTIRDEALNRVKSFLATGTKEEIQEKIRKGIAAFAVSGISEQDLLRLLGKKLTTKLNSDDYLSMLGMRNALKDGYITKEQLLSEDPLDGADESLTKADQVMNLIRNGQEKKPSKPSEEPAPTSARNTNAAKEFFGE